MKARLKRYSAHDRMLFLRSFSGIAADDPNVARRFALRSEEVHFRSGDAIYSPDESIDSAYFVFEGEIEITYRHEGTTRTFGPGSGVGHLAIMSDAPVRAHATALTEVVALRIGAPQLQELFLQESEQMLHVMRLMARLLTERYEGLPHDPAGNSPSVLSALLAVPPESMDLADFMLVLSNTHARRQFSDDGLSAMARATRYTTLEPGDLLWSHEDRPTFFSVLVAGELSIEISGREVLRWSKAAPLGMWNRLLLSQSSRYDVRAVRPSGVMNIDCESTIAVFEDHPRSARGFAAMMARRLLSYNEGLS